MDVLWDSLLIIGIEITVFDIFTNATLPFYYRPLKHPVYSNSKSSETQQLEMFSKRYKMLV